MKKKGYQAPLVELVKIGNALSFLTQSFSSEGGLDDWGNGGEIGDYYDGDHNLDGLNNGGEFGN